MELLLEEIQKLMNLDMNKIFMEVFSDTMLQEEIIYQIQYVQLFKEGVTEDNVVLGYYSPYTESLNPEKRAGTHYTLLDTGAFYESMRITVSDTYFIIDADGQKDDKNLFEVYNERGNILGLTENSWEWLIEKITPMVSEGIAANI
jgi:hypothetical protein